MNIVVMFFKLIQLCFVLLQIFSLVFKYKQAENKLFLLNSSEGVRLGDVLHQ